MRWMPWPVLLRILLPSTPVNSVGFLKRAQGRDDYGGDLYRWPRQMM
jgi:hypothetical protein